MSLIASYEMQDVWLNVIGPKLSTRDIVVLSMVNRWARQVAHNIHTHEGHTKLSSLSEPALRQWPHLKHEVKLANWEQDPSNSNNNVSLPIWSLELIGCKIHSFQFVDTTKLENLVIHGMGEQRSHVDTEETISSELVVFDSLGKMLTSCTSLKSLQLSCCVNLLSDISWMTHALTSVTNTTSINLLGNYLGASRMRELVPSFAHNPHLTALNLRLNALTTEGLEYVANVLSYTPHLTELNLSMNDICSGGGLCLASALLHTPNLTALHLHHNKLGPEGAKALLTPLPYLTNLCILNLIDNGLNDEIRSALCKQLPHVKQLYCHS
eukprot:c15028_g1_i1.p1 GENE.c15028_g1_i1~~c15028_g1_i1.p1  ORF type:complete len:332 (-),score=66.36 c15028_g1_i1:53-1027(-)